MATQYTAGLSVGQVLTAATMNSIGAAWETWTPTYSASGGGTITTMTTNLARYARIQKIVFVELDCTVTNAGTGTGFLTFTLPITAKNTRNMGYGREIAATGNMLAVDNTATTSALILGYNAFNTVITNYRLGINMFYEAA